MKRLIFLNFLLTTIWLPYAMHRWLTLPYSAAAWESYLLYSSAGVVTLIALLNALLVLLFKSKRARLLVLKIIAGLLAVLLFFPIIMGALNGYSGSKAWVDALALGILYFNLHWLHRVYRALLVSYENDNS